MTKLKELMKRVRSEVDNADWIVAVAMDEAIEADMDESTKYRWIEVVSAVATALEACDELIEHIEEGEGDDEGDAAGDSQAAG